MNPGHRQSTFHQSGFSLVELLIGLVIGLLATLVITQVLSVFEGQKRTTTGVADAQTNGSIALYTIQRDLQMAGYGLLPTGIPGVADSAFDCSALTIDPSAGVSDIGSVTITDGGVAGGSDSITIRYSTTDSGGIPSQLASVAGNNVYMNNNMACQKNDTALIMNGANCYLTTVTDLSAAAVTPASVTLNDPTGAVSNANLACLGAWKEILYSVSNGNLMKNETPSDPSKAVTSVVDIVNIQAQYGIGDPAAANPNRIVQWVDASGSWAAPSISDRNRIKAVRIAIVARNGLLEKTDVTSTCSSLTSDPPLTGLCTWSGTSASPDIASPAPAIDLSSDPNWKRYRYRVFETIVPLRNVIWAKSTL